MSNRTNLRTWNPPKSKARDDSVRHAATVELNCHAGGRGFESRPLRDLTDESLHGLSSVCAFGQGNR